MPPTALERARPNDFLPPHFLYTLVAEKLSERKSGRLFLEISSWGRKVRSMRNSAGSAGTLGLGLVAQADPAVLPARGRGPGVAQSPFTDVTSSTLALEDRVVAGQRRKKTNRVCWRRV